MKTFTDYLTMHLPTKAGFVNVTDQVQEAVQKSGVRDGLCLVNAMHITASVFINDDERGLHHDFGVWLEIRNADFHDFRDTDTTREIYVAESKATGIKRNRRRVLLVRAEVVAVSRLDDIVSD